jgi:hypothetical protein
MWAIYSFTKPIVRPTISDIRFKRHLEHEIEELENRKIRNGLQSLTFAGNCDGGSKN